MGLGRGGFLANLLAGLAGGYSQAQDRNQERQFRQQQYDLERQRLEQSSQQFSQEQADKLRYQQAAAVQAYGGNSPESIQRGAAIMGGQFPQAPQTVGQGVPYYVASPSTPVNYPGGTDPFGGIKPDDPDRRLQAAQIAASAHLFEHPLAAIQYAGALQKGPVPQQGSPGFQYQPQGGGQPPPTIGGFPTSVPPQLGVNDYTRMMGQTVESQKEAGQLQRETMRERARTDLMTARDTLGQYKTKTQARTAIIGKYIQAGGAPEYAGTYADSILQGYEPPGSTPPSPAGTAPPPVKAGAAPGVGGSLDIAKMFPKGTTAQAGIALKGAQASAQDAARQERLSRSAWLDTQARLQPDLVKARIDNFKSLGTHRAKLDALGLQRAQETAQFHQGLLTNSAYLNSLRAIDTQTLGLWRAHQADKSPAEKIDPRTKLEIDGLTDQIKRGWNQVDAYNKKALDYRAQGDPNAEKATGDEAARLTTGISNLVKQREDKIANAMQTTTVRPAGTAVPQPGPVPNPQIRGIGRRGAVPVLPPGIGTPAGPPGGIARRGSGKPPSREAADAMLRASGASAEERAFILKRDYGR